MTYNCVLADYMYEMKAFSSEVIANPIPENRMEMVTEI